jgi:hypothetical protein
MTDLTEREALALEMHRTPDHPGGYGWQAYLPMADRVVAAGFVRRTVVRTVEEFNELEIGTVLRLADADRIPKIGEVALFSGHPGFRGFNGAHYHKEWVSKALPARVLWVPAADRSE